MEFTDIKVDTRGTILKYKIGSKKFLLVITEKGALRAGEIHNIDQYTLLLQGIIMVILKQKNKDMQYVFKGRKKIKIPKGTPHYFRFLEDSIMIENNDENMTTEYYPEYRKLVEKSLIDSH
mgnify:CR=1 FL=1